jgi:hypothetical protein
MVARMRLRRIKLRLTRVESDPQPASTDDRTDPSTTEQNSIGTD